MNVSNGCSVATFQVNRSKKSFRVLEDEVNTLFRNCDDCLPVDAGRLRRKFYFS
jgi:hypothetical protein